MDYYAELKANTQEQEEQDRGLIANVIDVPLGAVDGIISAGNAILHMPADLLQFLGVNNEEETKAFKANGFTIPKINPESDSTTYKVAEAVSQFLVPYAAVAKGINVAAKVNTKGRALVAGAAAGAATDFLAFDGEEDRLSNVLNQLPEDHILRNAVTAYLAADEDDYALEGRFKNTLEGAILGTVFAGAGNALFSSIKAFKQTRQIKKKVSAHKEAIKEVTDDNVKNAVKNYRGGKETLSIQAQKDFAKSVDVPLADIESGKLLAEIKDTKYAKQLTNATIRQEEVFTQVQNNLVHYASRATLGDVKAYDDWFNNQFTKILEIDNAVKNVHSDIARNLNIRSKSEAVVTINQIVKKVQDGGIKSKQALFEAFNENALDPVKSKTFMRNFVNEPELSIGNLVFKAYVNSALASLKTLLVDTWSNPMFSAMLAGERAVAAGIGSVRKGVGKVVSPETLQKFRLNMFTSGDQVAGREALAMLDQYSMTITNGLRYIAHAARGTTERAERFKAANKKLGFFKDVGKELKDLRIDSQTRFDSNVVINPASQYLGVAKDSTVGRIANAVETALGGYSTRYMRGKDDVVKMIMYRADVAARAHRQARFENLQGADYHNRVKELIDVPMSQGEAGGLGRSANEIRDALEGNTDTATIQRRISEDALNFARESTYTKELGDIGKVVNEAIEALPGAKYVMPFRKTPTNLLKQALVRTPLAPIAKSIRKEIAQGGATADIALSRIAMGSGLVFLAYQLAASGKMTAAGPLKKKERDAQRKVGFRPFSLIVGDKSIEYGRYDPISAILSIGPAISEIVDHYDNDLDGKMERDLGQLVDLTVLQASQLLLNKSYFRGFAELIDAITSGNEKSFGNYLDFMGSTVVPNNVAFIANQVQPFMQETEGLLEKLKAKMGVDVRRKLDIFGEPITKDPQLLGYMIPSSHSNIVKGGVHKDLAEIGAFLPMPQRKIDGVQITMDEHHKLMTIMRDMGVKKAVTKVLSNVRGLPNVARTGIPNAQNLTQSGVVLNVYNNFVRAARLRLIATEPGLQLRIKQHKDLLKTSSPVPKGTQRLLDNINP